MCGVQPTSVITIFCFEHFLEIQWLRRRLETFGIIDFATPHLIECICIYVSLLRFVRCKIRSICLSKRTCNTYPVFCRSFYDAKCVPVCTDRGELVKYRFCIALRSRSRFLSEITIILSFMAIFRHRRTSGVGVVTRHTPYILSCACAGTQRYPVRIISVDVYAFLLIYVCLALAPRSMYLPARVHGI